MIIVRLLGGMGNQMFQYAAGLALAEARRTVLKLDVSWFREDPAHAAHNRYALSCFNITEQFATEEDIRLCRGVQFTRTERWAATLARALRLYQFANAYQPRGRWHIENQETGDPGFAQLPDGTYLDGMFQSEDYFRPVADLLRAHFSFRYPAAQDVEAMAARIRSGPSAAVHFRRGDYLSNPEFARKLGPLDWNYQRRAVELLRKRQPDATLYLFSDDIETVEREFTPDGPHVFVHCGRPWDKIRLMSLCNHYAVSNSTFCWWGAWLNPSPDKCVIAPHPWFTDPEHTGNRIVPPSWTLLPRNPET